MTIKKTAKEWINIKRKIKTKWSKLSNPEIEAFKDDMDRISGKIAKAYGYTKDKAELDYEEFMKSLVPAVTAVKKA